MYYCYYIVSDVSQFTDSPTEEKVQHKLNAWNNQLNWYWSLTTPIFGLCGILSMDAKQPAYDFLSVKKASEMT